MRLVEDYTFVLRHFYPCKGVTLNKSKKSGVHHADAGDMSNETYFFAMNKTVSSKCFRSPIK